MAEIIREGNYLQPARRKALPLKLGLFGPSKSGKTYSGLKLMRGILGPDVPFAVIDTENRASEEYQGDPEVGEFDIAPFHGNFAADRFVRLLADIVKFGYPGIVVDGISPLWNGPGGVQAVADANNTGKQKFGGWEVANAEHQKIVRAIVECPVHLICTMRSKTAYVVGEDGKTRKVGLKPEQRDGIEYEFRLLAEMDVDNQMKITGRRGFQNRIVPKPGAELANELKQYLGSEQAHDDDADARLDRAAAAATSPHGDGPNPVAAPPEASQPGDAPAVVPMRDPEGGVHQIPADAVAGLLAAGWKVGTDDPQPAAETPLQTPGAEQPSATSTPSESQTPSSPQTSSPTPQPELPVQQSAASTDATPAPTPPAPQAAATDSLPTEPSPPQPTPQETTTGSASTNGTTHSDKMSAGQLEEIVKLCQELATLRPDKGDQSHWMDWANAKALEHYQQDMSSLTQQNTAGLIERMKKTILALKEAS